MARDTREQTAVDQAAQNCRKPPNPPSEHCSWDSPNSPRPCTHVVTQGQNLSMIASHYGLSLAQVEQDNPQFRPDFNLIRPCDEVKIRKR